MAEANVSACAGAINTAHSPEMIMAFVRFVATLADMIATERNLAGYSAEDPAVDRAITIAEQARETALNRLDAVRASAPPISSPLHVVELLFRAALHSEDPADVARLRRLARTYNREVSLPRRSRLDELVAGMIYEALDRLDAYLAIEDGDSGAAMLHPVQDRPAPATEAVPAPVI